MPKNKITRLEKKADRLQSRADKTISKYKKVSDQINSGLALSSKAKRLEEKGARRQSRATNLRKKVDQLTGKNATSKSLSSTKGDDMAKFQAPKVVKRTVRERVKTQFNKFNKKMSEISPFRNWEDKNSLQYKLNKSKNK